MVTERALLGEICSVLWDAGDSQFFSIVYMIEHGWSVLGDKKA